MLRRVRIATAIAFTLPQPSLAQMKVRVGQPQAGTFQFVPLQVASEAGIFKRHGIDVDVVSFGEVPAFSRLWPRVRSTLASAPGPSSPSWQRAPPKSPSPPLRTRPIRSFWRCCGILRSRRPRISRVGPSVFPAKDP